MDNIDEPIGEYVNDPPYLEMRLRMLLTGTASPTDSNWASVLKVLLDELEWKPMESAPREPIVVNHINDYSPAHCGPQLILLIDWSEGIGDPNRSVTTGWWSLFDGCWRHGDDDGPHDVQPVAWRPIPSVLDK